MKIVLGTRGSDLAVGQAESLVHYLEATGHAVEWRRFTTHGDRWLAGPLDKAVGTGFFTRELEEALSSGAVDLLIHSFKDVALERPEGFAIACVPLREDPADWLVLRRDAPGQPRIATSSERRLRFLRRAFPGSEFTWIRGNVPTRVQRVREGLLRNEPIHATVLAAAGLRRLGLDLSDLDVRPLPFDDLLPAPAQGALLAETRADRPDIIEALRGLHDPLTARCVGLERAVLAGIGGGCQQPLGAFAEPLPDGSIRLRAAFAGDAEIRYGTATGMQDEELVESVVKDLGMVKRLGLARAPEDALSRVVVEAGWEPVPVFLTEMVATGSPRPLDHPDAVILLSPAGARAGVLPAGVPVLVTGHGSAAALEGCEVLVSPEPRAEGLWTLLQARFPAGGQFLLVRGERSRGYLEEVAEGTPWRLVSWITHTEKAKDPLPELPVLDAVLALSPLQGELLGPKSRGILRFAWGKRTADAFQHSGNPAHDSCLARPEALGRMLAPYV